MTSTLEAPALEVSNLRVAYRTEAGPVEVVRDVSFSIRSGETLCLVGESGCGKSASVLAVSSLLPSTGQVVGGSVALAGRDISHLSDDELVGVRGCGIGMVFQESLAALNPLLSVGRQLTESLTQHRGLKGQAARVEAARLLAEVGIGDPEGRLRQYPHELSGGLRQRVCIAIALAANPRVLIADEPTTALDVTVQGQILELLRREQRDRSMAVLLITHDLGVVAAVADRVAVMYAGEIVESGLVDEVFSRPRHPYTAGLLRSLPRIDDDPGIDLYVIPGQPPQMTELPSGCSFRPRCSFATQLCEIESPPSQDVSDTATVACWHPQSGEV